MPRLANQAWICASLTSWQPHPNRLAMSSRMTFLTQCGATTSMVAFMFMRYRSRYHVTSSDRLSSVVCAVPHEPLYGNAAVGGGPPVGRNDTVLVPGCAAIIART